MLNNQSGSVVVETKVDKWTRECLAEGFKWLEKVDRARSLCECLVCGHQDTYEQSAMRKGNVSCSNCLTTKLSNECLAEGFKFIHRIDAKKTLCECLTCGHQDTFQQQYMRKGKVSCSNCLTTKWSNECLAQGFKLIHKIDGHSSLCECLSCGYQDTYHQGSMRKGEASCSNCLTTKWSRECAEQGFKWLAKVDANYSLCECLSCGHQDTYNQGAMRKGEVACSNCSPGHWNETSWFYMIKISPNDQESFVKIGISNNPSRRYAQYGLPEGTIVEELTKVLFQTKIEAVGYETAVMKFLEPFHIEPEIAKNILTKSGWTECFTIDSLNHLLDERGFHQLSLAVE